MSSLNCSLLCHTFNQYEKYWDGFLNGWKNYIHDQELQNSVWGHEDIDNYYFGTDEPFHVKHDFGRFKVIYSGKGEWSDRLINLLTQIPTEYVLYMQEDQWPTAGPPNIAKLLAFMVQNDVWRLQISPIVQFYSLVGCKIPLYFHWKSKYLMSHQPSIWKKDFLLSCLQPNENPWKNEYEATKRLNKPEIQGRIAIYPHSWYSHESISKQNQPMKA